VVAEKECRHCHQVKTAELFCRHKWSKDGLHSYCKQCSRETAKAYRLANPERVKNTKTLYRQTEHGARKNREQSNKWRLANPERYKQLRKAHSEQVNLKRPVHRLLAEYGLTSDQFDALLISQTGRCAICASALIGKRAANVDHCHVTGLVRGLLCTNCNCGLGRFRDDTSRLVAAADYLERHR
jgi:hypothetical protein